MNIKSLLPLLVFSTLLFAAFWLLAAASFNPNAQPVGYVAQPAITNFDISSGHEVAFRTDYDRNTWAGNLLAIPVGANGTADNSTANWQGAVAIDGQNPTDSSGRLIFTRNGSVGVPFRWTNLSSAQQGLISSNSTTGQNILNYVRGDRSNENPSGAKYYKRASAMGAVIHSAPRYFDDGTDQVVYVGANDGMLHAFDASSGSMGRELWAYVPSMLIGNLNKLVVDPYVMQYYVDGHQTIAIITVSGSEKVVLTGGLGAGGKGLYALDITDQTPSSEVAAANMSLWEITNTSAGFSDLGYTYGTPHVARVNTGAEALIVGNGYANSGNGKASLFVIDAATGALIREIATTGADTGSVAAPNGLSSARLLDTNGDGKVDIAYAGDLDGHLWKFDLSSSSSASWSASLLYTTSPVQAITTMPSARFHPNGGYMVLFATGRMLTTADTTDTSTYYAYGIWDGAPSANTSLVSQTLTEKSYSAATPAIRVRTATINTLNWASGGNRGWKTALPVAGEKVTGDGAFVQGDRFSFTSTNPTVVNSTKPDGENWLNELDYLSGGSPSEVVFDLNSDGVVDTLDLLSNSGIPITTNLGRPVSKFLRSGLASQPILVRQTTLDNTLLTFNPDSAVPPPPVDLGVSGGHFDVDIFYGSNHNIIYDSTGSSIEQSWTDNVPDGVRHYHQYDDVFDVTGVDMLNPSSTNLKLANIPSSIMSSSTQFKVLVYNQYYSPAVQISVGSAAYVPVRDYAGQTAASLNFSALPTYTLSNIGSLVVKMPLDTFTAKDWAGDGDSRAGLLPTAWDCVAPYDLGILGSLHNGALTVQLVKASAANTDIVLNVTGHPEMGYRVKNSARSADILVEYSIYWHMPNSGFPLKVGGASYTKICSDNAVWSDSPPQESGSTATQKTRAAGSTDPKAGTFTPGSSVVSDVTTSSGATTTRTTTYSDGVVRIIVTVDNGDGTITTTTTFKDSTGAVISSVTTTAAVSGSTVGEGGEQINSNAYGRQSWREL